MKTCFIGTREAVCNGHGGASHVHRRVEERSRESKSILPKEGVVKVPIVSGLTGGQVRRFGEALVGPLQGPSKCPLLRQSFPPFDVLSSILSRPDRGGLSDDLVIHQGG